MSALEMAPDVFTADYVGEPGKRAFYLQGRGSFGARSYEIEKLQVGVLAEKMRELLVLVDADDTVATTQPARDPALKLEPPETPEWRVGAIGLAYDEEADRILVAMQPVDAAEDEEELLEGAEGHRYYLRRDQARSFVLHAIAVVAEGRPLCQLCGLPMDAEGHDCPARNGHRG